MLFAVGIVALFYALRSNYAFGHDEGLGETIRRIRILTPLFGFLMALYVCFSLVRTSRWWIVAGATSLGAGIAGSLSATHLGYELAAALQRSYPEYWNWLRDGQEFALLIGREALTASAVGFGILLQIEVLWKKAWPCNGSPYRATAETATFVFAVPFFIAGVAANHLLLVR